MEIGDFSCVFFYIRVFFLQIGIMGFDEDRISEYKITIKITSLFSNHYSILLEYLAISII